MFGAIGGLPTTTAREPLAGLCACPRGLQKGNVCVTSRVHCLSAANDKRQPSPATVGSSQRQQRSHTHNLSRVTATASADAPTEVSSVPDLDVRLVDYTGGTYTVAGGLHTNVPPERVWALLTDYTNLARVYSSVEDSQLANEEGLLTLRQVCRWEFLMFSGTFRTHLHVDESEEDGMLTFSLIDSGFMRDFQGRWQIRETQGGGTRIEHRLSVKPIVSPPRALASYTQQIFVRQVARVLQDLEQALEYA